MNLHTYVCFVYDVVHHFKQHNSWGRTKMERKEGRKTRVQVFYCILCNFFLTFEIGARGKYLSPKNLLFNHTICVSIQIDLEQFCT